MKKAFFFAAASVAMIMSSCSITLPVAATSNAIGN